MNNRQISGDVLASKRQGLADMLSGNITAATQMFSQDNMQKNEQIDRKLGALKAKSEPTVSRQDYEKEISSDAFNIDSRMQQQRVEQQPNYQQPQQQYYQQQPQQQQYPQSYPPQQVNEGYNQQPSSHSAAAPVPSDMIQNMLDGRGGRNQQQHNSQQHYPQQQPSQPYQYQSNMLNEDTKRELANDIVAHIKGSFLREEIMSVLMEDVFSTDRMNKILTENFERLLKGYLLKQQKNKAVNTAGKK